MKYKTLFRLFLKACGAYLFVSGFPGVVSVALMQIEWAAQRSRGVTTFPSGWPWAIVTFVEPLVRMSLGAYLFFGGRWIVNLAIPSNRPYCPECAYDLTGAVEPRCPECGTAFRWEDVRPKCEAQSTKSEEQR